MSDSKRIEYAEGLSIKPDIKSKQDYVEYDKRIHEAIAIYKEICLDPKIKWETRYCALVSFIKHISDEGKDMLSRLRDFIPFYKGEALQDIIEILVRICQTNGIDSHERLFTAVTLYNRCFYEYCFKAFQDVASDDEALVDHRIEACRYLFASESEKPKQISQDCLINIIEDQSLPSEYRYKVVAGFISRSGISTILNSTKLPIPYDGEFTHGLQSVFFFNKSNGTRERILSGQHILDMPESTSEEKKDVGEQLLQIARDMKHENNIRADAADVILRLGDETQAAEARNIITDIGFSNIGKTGDLLTKRVQVIYSNQENVHDQKISETVCTFIEQMFQEKITGTKSFNEVYNEVTELLRSKKFSSVKRFCVIKALNRVSVDTARFSKNKVTITEIFTHVWTRIQKYDKETRIILEDRLFEELEDMADTCSSGHAARFVNVLSEFDVTLRISWEDQIHANIVGRINAKIRAHPDSEKIMLGIMENADKNDKDVFTNFLEENIPKLRGELHKEFVDDGYIKNKEFDKFFETGVKKLYKA